MNAVSSLGILLVAAVFIVVLIAVFKSKSTVMIATFFAFVIGLFLTVFFVRSERQVAGTRNMVWAQSHQTGRDEEHQVARRSAATTGSNWNEIDTALFQAEVYSGIKPAAISLAHRIGPMVTANTDAVDFPVLLTLKKSISDECRFAFQDALQKQLPKISLITEIADTPGKPKETEEPNDTQQPTVRLTLEVVDPTTHPAAWNATGQFESGDLACTVSVEGQTTKQISVVYNEKPWVDRWDQFVSKHPSHRYVVCTSSDLRSSPGSASESAMRNLQRIQLDAGTINHQKIWVQPNQTLIVDRFTQKLTRPYGDVWREALLVDLEGPEAEELKATARANHHRIVREQRSAESQTWWQCLLLVAVFAAVAILGMVLNLVTEGYFRGRIVGSIAVVALIAFGTILVFRASN